METGWWCPLVGVLQQGNRGLLLRFLRPPFSPGDLQLLTRLHVFARF